MKSKLVVRIALYANKQPRVVSAILVDGVQGWSDGVIDMEEHVIYLEATERETDNERGPAGSGEPWRPALLQVRGATGGCVPMDEHPEWRPVQEGMVRELPPPSEGARGGEPEVLPMQEQEGSGLQVDEHPEWGPIQEGMVQPV